MLSVLDLSLPEDKQEYQSRLDSLDSRHPYYRLEFFEIFAAGTENMICFAWQNKADLILNPGYLNPIPGSDRYFDFISPYGYSGPISNVTEPETFHVFWNACDSWLKDQNAVSEFIRFSLNDVPDTYNGTVVRSLSNIKGTIIDPEAQWMAFDHKVRKNVKRANREQLSFSIVSGSDISSGQLDEFHRIYTSTMERNKAASHFFYSHEDFARYAAHNPEYCAFAFVHDQDEAVSVEMILISDDSIFSFLGGTERQAYPKRPNDLLKFELINWARDRQLNYFVLGGGYGAEDGIFQYKRAFFPQDVTGWYTGRKILDENIYQEICNAVDVSAKPDLAADFFPEYRQSA